MKWKICIKIILLVIAVFRYSDAESVVINGGMVQTLVGTGLDKIRICDGDGNPVLFQIDEIADSGEYVCQSGEEPNGESSNGVLDSLDEIVFLWNDCSKAKIDKRDNCKSVPVKIKKGSETRYVLICDDTTVSLSGKRYINYDHETQMLSTPYYYAQFGKDRFHFISAGVKNFGSGNYVTLTNELRVKILLRALWGLLPIRYSEDNLVCVVKRYKIGPIRAIRRGDFHLNLGLGLKGSRASVNQICYPTMVKVPVYVHVPVKFRAFFSEAYIEITPVIKSSVEKYEFFVPELDFRVPVKGTEFDTLITMNPNNKYMTVNDGVRGYGWMLKADIPDTLLRKSSIVFNGQSVREGGASDCGFRMTLRDLPKGYYNITNWVLFPGFVKINKLDDYFESGIAVSEIFTENGRFRNRVAE
ncbi:MAG: hypothetical protein Q4F84_01750 [Fibrobacter sp.]|nr:hypothetical protein [Fibrobacter sp.]